ncbi:hypothetical protein Tco_0127154 [Tanacetum coccineum]
MAKSYDFTSEVRNMEKIFLTRVLMSIQMAHLKIPYTPTTTAYMRERTYEDLTEKENIRTELSLQERESKLYNEFDQFTSEKEETVHSYYLRFSQLISDMNTIGMTMQDLQVNTKFVNNLQPE